MGSAPTQPYINDADFQLYVGDVREVLATLPAESVHCVVTSPPYHGLRDYSAEGQIGLETTLEEYVAVMVDVFREVRRVMRSDATAWVNLGDAFQDKQLQGAPWRVLFALQADGWYARSDIIWAKPNPMPESVTDRPTKAHEYVFLLTKSPRYYFDAEAVREKWADERNGASGATTSKFAHPGAMRQDGGVTQAPQVSGRNIRSVWSFATQPYPDAHFATFPEALPERCIKAGTSERGCCPECGAPWVRQTDVEYVKSPVHGSGSVVGRHEVTGANNFDGAGMPRLNKNVTTTGWQPSCGCLDAEDNDPHDPIPCRVLDPFMGSGTTAYVARKLGRRAIGIELNPEYAELCARRLQQQSLFAGDVA